MDIELPRLIAASQAMDLGGWIWIAPVAIVVLRLASNRWDRDTIANDVHRHGCQVCSIHWDPFGAWWRGKGRRAYQVVYHTPSGTEVTTTCITGIFSGIEWQSDAPAGYGRRSQDLLQDIVNDDSGEVTCFSCGAVMPSQVTRCTCCGWTYET